MLRGVQAVQEASIGFAINSIVACEARFPRTCASAPGGERMEACGLAVRKGLVRGAIDMHEAGVKGTSACIGAGRVVGLGKQSIDGYVSSSWNLSL